MKKLLLAGVAALFLATGTAHAAQRPHAIVSQPKIITRTVPGALMPPPKYDKLYEGVLEIQHFSSAEDVQRICKSLGGSGSETGCARIPNDHKQCWLFIANEDLAKHEGRNYAFILRHELAHCNGWKHPSTTGGRKFNIGDKWDEAEGGKWLRADTKMAMPTLPAGTRILPASPPVVCVTPDWKPEPCENRKPKDVWSTARPFQMNDIPKKVER